jgi:hypothetical protein
MIRAWSSIFVSASCLAASVAWGQDWSSLEDAVEVSSETAAGALPGAAARGARLLRLTQTVDGSHDGRLVAVYADANHDEAVWSPLALEHLPRDVFVRHSDDGGKTWTDPVNVSNSANLFSALTDHDGDGAAEPYFGDCEDPVVFASGDRIVVAWIGAYVPAPGWEFGDVGANAAQGAIEYEDDALKVGTRTVPFHAVFAAVSTDCGSSWVRGDIAHHAPALQLTAGARDAARVVQHGAGSRWALAWQEDPNGSVPVFVDDGDDAAGAWAANGTDVWYTFAANVAAFPDDLVSHVAPLSNHSAYDLTLPGAPLSGPAGSIEGHAAVRPALALVVDGSTIRALVAYEESKADPGDLDGARPPIRPLQQQGKAGPTLGTPESTKDVVLASGATSGRTIQFHSFAFDAPAQGGAPTSRSGSAGTTVSSLLENARSAQLASRTPNGIDPALCVVWRQGFGKLGTPADVVGKLAPTLDEPALAAAVTRNFSADTPTALPADLGDSTATNPVEDAFEPRLLLRGPDVFVGYAYAAHRQLARTTDQQNYDFWLRRSTDGGTTWLAPENLTTLPPTANVLDVALIAPPELGPDVDPALVVAFGARTKSSGLAGDLFIRRTRDLGATWTPAMPFANTPEPEFAPQLVATPSASTIGALWLRNGLVDDAMFAELSNAWFTPGDRLSVTFPNAGATADAEFDALFHERLRLTFPKSKTPARVRVLVYGPVEDIPGPALAVPIKSFVVKVGKARIRRVVRLPMTGRYRLSFEHVALNVGPIVVKTGRSLPLRARPRNVTMKPHGPALACDVLALLLEDATLDLVAKPKKGFAGSLAVGFDTPLGAAFDLSGFDVSIGAAKAYAGVPAPSIGAYTVGLSGFSKPSESVRLKIVPHQPPPGDAQLALP